MDPIIFGAEFPQLSIKELLERLSTWEQHNNCQVQIFNAGSIIGEEHLKSAYCHALRNQEREDMISSSLKMEIMLYAAGVRQIDKALDMVGIKDCTTSVVGILLEGTEKDLANFLSEFDAERNDALVSQEGKDPSLFNIRSGDITGQVLEKVALLDLNR